jgi:hypothetical protein
MTLSTEKGALQSFAQLCSVAFVSLTKDTVWINREGPMGGQLNRSLTTKGSLPEPPLVQVP